MKLYVEKSELLKAIALFEKLKKGHESESSDDDFKKGLEAGYSSAYEIAIDKLNDLLY